MTTFSIGRLKVVSGRDVFFGFFLWSYGVSCGFLGLPCMFFPWPYGSYLAMISGVLFALWGVRPGFTVEPVFDIFAEAEARGYPVVRDVMKRERETRRA